MKNNFNRVNWISPTLSKVYFFFLSVHNNIQLHNYLLIELFLFFESKLPNSKSLMVPNPQKSSFNRTYIWKKRNKSFLDKWRSIILPRIVSDWDTFAIYVIYYFAGNIFVNDVKSLSKLWLFRNIRYIRRGFQSYWTCHVFFFNLADRSIKRKTNFCPENYIIHVKILCYPTLSN